LYPTTVDVLATQDRVTVWVASTVLVPESAITFGPLEALLVTVMLPVAAPLAAGENVTFMVPVCPGVSMVPAGTPLAVKPAPAMLTFEIVTFDVPAFARVTLCMLLLDTVTLPKFRLAALALRTSVLMAGAGVPLTGVPLTGVPLTAVAVSVTEMLVTLPMPLVTTTLICEPLSEAVVAGTV
jgi:hypothetical protein